VFRTFVEFTDCSQMMLVLSPNPATGETVASLKSASDEITVDQNTEWDMDIYSESTLLKEKKTKLRGKSTRANSHFYTQNLQ